MTTNSLARDLDHVLAHTGSIWEQLEGARIFVTGGTGFFGCWLLESFCWACDRLNVNASMMVLTRSPAAFRAKAPHLASHPAIHLRLGDVRRFEFPEGRFSHVIHAATEANARLGTDAPDLMLDTIVEGTRRTLDFARAAGAKRFLLTSSGAVYTDWDSSDPRSVYAKGKRTAEELCTLYARQYGIACLIARCFAFVGPYLPLDSHYAIGNFISDCIGRRAIEIRGDGTSYRSYLYSADLAIWLWTILMNAEPGDPYNVGSERAISIADLAALVGRELQAVAPIRVRQRSRPGAVAERYVPDTCRTRIDFGLEEWTSLEEAIRRTAEWHAPATALAQGGRT